MVLKKICLVDFFCWIGIFGYEHYATDFFTVVVYGGHSSDQFDKGVQYGSIGLLLHSTVGEYFFVSLQPIEKSYFGSSAACMFSLFFQEKLIDRIGLKKTFASGLFLFAISMMACAAAPNMWVVFAFNALSGIGKYSLNLEQQMSFAEKCFE